MSAIAMKQRTQQLPSAAHQTPRALLPDPQAPIHFMDLTEARQLAQFATIVVLAPEPFTGDGVALSAVGGDYSRNVSLETFNLLDFFNQMAPQSRASYTHSDFEFGDLKVNFSSMEVSRGGESVALTALEFKTLKYLVQNARRVISRDELLSEVWGYENYPTTRVVDNQVANLRKKMERDAARPIHFRTVHGAGYKFLP